jgi:hypothetical protein
MMTWRLWRALTHPPYRHPLFWRTVSTREPDAITWRPWVNARIVLAGLVLLVCGGMVFPRHINGIVMAGFLIIPFLLLIFTFNGLIYGLVWGVKISSSIAKSYEANTFDLLALAPTGALGATWAMGTGCLYRNRNLGDLNFPETWTIRLFVIIFTAMTLGSMSGPDRGSNLVMLVLVYVLVLMAGFYVDDIQSIILGSLVGMLTPIYARTRLDARLWTLGTYLLIQITTYVCSLLSGFVLLPTFYQQLEITGPYTRLSLPIMGLIVFFGIRELLITALWHDLARRLNADPKELNLLSGKQVS